MTTNSLKEQFSSFKQSFVAEVSQFKNDFLQKQATNTDGNTTEKLLQQMEKEIYFLHDELNSKSTGINLLLELNRRNITYNFRHLQEFQSERKRNVFDGLETLSYRASQLWTVLPKEIKQRNTINLFKSDVNNGYVKNVLADYAKCLYQTYDLFNILLLSRYCLLFKGALSGLRRFLATENPLKW